MLINAEPSRIATLAQQLSDLKGVGEVYSVAGDEDLVAIVRVQHHDELAEVVTQRISALEGIVATRTLIRSRRTASTTSRPCGPSAGSENSPVSKSFGEEGGRLDYGSYLELETLLVRATPRTDAHDELLFITVHQVYELWFKLLLHELEAARDAMLADDVAMARQCSVGCRVIERLLSSRSTSSRR